MVTGRGIIFICSTALSFQIGLKEKQLFHAFYHDIANERIFFSIYSDTLSFPPERFSEYADESKLIIDSIHKVTFGIFKWENISYAVYR